jgi:glycosyltransferase involved in cell wall biosynthesis
MIGQPAGVQIVTSAGDRSHPWVARFVEAMARALPVQFVEVGLPDRDLSVISSSMRCIPSMSGVHAQRSLQADELRKRSLRRHRDDRAAGWRRVQIYTNTVSECSDVDVLFTDVLLDTVARSSGAIPGYVWNERDLRSALIREREVLEAAELVLVPTQWLARDISLNIDAKLASKVVVVGWGPGNEPPSSVNPVEGPVPGEIARNLSLLFVGNEAGRKGLDPLVSAFREARRKGLPVTLTLVGDLPTINESGIFVVGYVDTSTPAGREHFHRILRSADVLVLPTTFEPVGCIFIEAMQAGLAIVSNDVCAVAEVVPPTCGWLVGRDAANLHDALHLVCESGDLASKQQAASARGAHFSWAVTARTILEAMSLDDRRST